MREPRLGDDIDDYCVRCKRIMNHSVVSVLNAEPAKVRCRTCHSDHDFRHELAPPPKVDPRKQALFNAVLEKVNPDAAPVEVDAAEAAAAEAPGAEVAVGEVPPPAAAAPKAKAPAKAKAKGRK